MNDMMLAVEAAFMQGLGMLFQKQTVKDKIAELIVLKGEKLLLDQLEAMKAAAAQPPAA